MTSTKLFTSILALAVLTACGGSPAAAPADTTATGTDAASGVDPSMEVGGDPGGALLDPSASDASALGVPGTVPDAAASTAAASKGYILKGLVTDAIGKPLQGATISIGSQTALSAGDGTFEIDTIMDTQIHVDVSMSGYQPITAYAVNFTAAVPTADKEFKLVSSTTTVGSTGTGGATSGTSTTTPTGGFTEQATFNPTTFKSVAAMTVSGDTAYVLGMVKALILTHNTVVAINAATGEEISSFYKTGWFTTISKASNSIWVTGGQVHVSDGTTTDIFATNGTLIQKTTGAAVANSVQGTDSTRGLTYRLNGTSKVDVSGSNGTTTYDLPDATAAISLGLDTKGDILVLDGSKEAVVQYTFTQ